MFPQSTMMRVAVLAIAIGAVGGCSGKAFVKPRSQLAEESEALGVVHVSVEAERANFFKREELHRRRFMALVKARANPRYRDTNYRLGPGDEVEVNVFDVPELNLTASVRQSGFIALPLVGAVRASELTETELSTELAKRLEAYVHQPQVSVFITNYASQRVAVLGAVKQPATYPLTKGKNSLVELLSQAGGLNERAGNLLIFIPAELSGLGMISDAEARARLALDGTEIPLSDNGIELYLDQVLGTSGAIPVNLTLTGGDMLIVPEAGKVMVEGEVEKPGSYDLSPQMTLLGALAASGGITYGAKTDEVEVIREVGLEQKARLMLDLEKIGRGEERDIRLRNGDILRVPSHSGRRLRQDTFEGISRIINFGVGGNVSLAK